MTAAAPSAAVSVAASASHPCYFDAYYVTTATVGVANFNAKDTNRCYNSKAQYPNEVVLLFLSDSYNPYMLYVGLR